MAACYFCQGLLRKINEDISTMIFPGTWETISVSFPSRQHHFWWSLLTSSQKLVATILKQLSKALNLPYWS